MVSRESYRNKYVPLMLKNPASLMQGFVLTISYSLIFYSIAPFTKTESLSGFKLSYFNVSLVELPCGLVLGFFLSLMFNIGLD